MRRAPAWKGGSDEIDRQMSRGQLRHLAPVAGRKSDALDAQISKIVQCGLDAETQLIREDQDACQPMIDRNRNGELARSVLARE